MGLVSFTAWQFLFLFALGIFSTLFVLMKPKKNRYMSMIKLGLFLALFDFAFETWGALAGLWLTTKSMVPLGAVPIEVFGIALMAGATYNLLFPKKFSWELGLASSLLIACAGTIIEAALISMGHLTYYGWWTSAHAVAGYFGTFFIMYALNSQV